MLKELNIFYTELGERIKTERLKRKIGQKELGEHLKLTRTSIVNFESGRHRPSLYQVIQIANFFKMNFPELIPFEYQGNRSSNQNANVSIVTDQDSLDKSTENAVLSFLSNLNKE